MPKAPRSVILWWWNWPNNRQRGKSARFGKIFPAAGRQSCYCHKKGNEAGQMPDTLKGAR